MRLEVSCDGSCIPAEISTEGGRRRLILDGREIACDWVSLPGGTYSVIIDGQVYDLAVEVTGETWTVVTRDGPVDLRLTDKRRLIAGRELGGGSLGLQRISADMPGKVVRVLVREGESVKYDQGLLVLEAMKMQNEIRAPKSGVVKQIGVAEGKAVNSGEFLISLE